MKQELLYFHAEISLKAIFQTLCSLR